MCPAITPKQVLESALRGIEIDLEPGLTEGEIDAFASRLPGLLPAEVRELLAYTRGFAGPEPVDRVVFTGEGLLFEMAEVFPAGVPIAADGRGNFWVVDVHPETGSWGPVFYAGHDVPLIVIQSSDLAGFLAEVLKLVGEEDEEGRLPESDVSRTHENDAVPERPGLMEVAEARRSDDAVLREFAAGLPDGAEITDLRAGELGTGFCWGRHGPRTVIARCGSERLFAVAKPEKQPGFFRRLLGG